MTETWTYAGTTTPLPTADDIALEWATSPRWHGISRTYSAEDVVRLRGTVQEEHTLARRGAEHLAQLLWLQNNPADWTHWWSKTALTKTKVNPGWPSCAPPTN